MQTNITGFDEALMKNPFDWELRRIYADYLEDQGEEAKAAFQRFAAELEVSVEDGIFFKNYYLFSASCKWWKRLPNDERFQIEDATMFEHRDKPTNRVDKSHDVFRDLEDTFVKLYLTGWRPTILPREQT